SYGTMGVGGIYRLLRACQIHFPPAQHSCPLSATGATAPWPSKWPAAQTVYQRQRADSHYCRDLQPDSQGLCAVSDLRVWRLSMAQADTRVFAETVAIRYAGARAPGAQACAFHRQYRTRGLCNPLSICHEDRDRIALSTS